MRVPGGPPRRSSRRIQDKAEEATPLDPVALTLAVWLGLIACVAGMVRLSDNAAAQAAVSRGLEGVRQMEAPRAFALGS